MIAFALGLVLGAWWLQQQAHLPNALAAWLLAFGLFLFFRFAAKFPLFLRQVSIFFLAALFGFVWAAALAKSRLADELPQDWEQKNITLIGVVASLPECDAQGERFRFDVEKIITKSAQVPRHISLSWYANQKAEAAPAAMFHAGERWLLTVRLKRPHGTQNPHNFDFEAWALAENMRATGSIKGKKGFKKLQHFVWKPAYMIEAVRERIALRIAHVLAGKPYAGVVAALVVGDDNAIPQADWQTYLRTGTNHLISISGLHITMLSGLAFSLAAFVWRRFPHLVLRLPTRKAATIFGALAALCYAALAGWSVPTQRTVWMLLTFAAALLFARQVRMAQALALALVVVTILDPWAVIAPGFWLSFGAVALIAFVVSNRLQAPSNLSGALDSQWAVTIGLLPLLVAMFGQTSLVSPLANAVAIPVISLLVVPLAIAGSLLPLDILLQLAHGILALCMQLLQWLASWPLATWQQAAAPAWAVVLAMLGVCWMLLPRGFPQRWLGAILLLPMLLAPPAQVKNGTAFVSVIDVGQGLSVLVQTAHHALVYDTGPRFNAQSDAGARTVVPYLRAGGIAKLDGLVLSHDDIDHTGGAGAVLAQVPSNWLLSSFEYTFEGENGAQKTKQLRCTAGQHWQWDGVTFEVLSPSLASYQNAEISDNNRSCVIKISSRHGSVLLTGDIEKEAEEALLQANTEALASDIVIAPHHGSKTSSTVGLVQAVGAKYAVMTVGYLNRFHHPKPFVEQRYWESGAQVLRSDYHGAIEICLCKPLAISEWRKAQPRYWHDYYSQ